jgi:hypothetical protein
MGQDFIRIAEVVAITDPGKAGVITCVWPGETGDFPVTYTTPFYSPAAGNENSSFAGMYAVPTEGANILVARAWNGRHWFYIASIPADPNNSLYSEKGIVGRPTGVSKVPYTSTLPAEELTKLSDRPWGVMLKSSGGAQLQMNDAASKEELGWRTTLQSMTKKILLMADNGDFQTFQNEHNDGLIITGDDYTGINGPRSSTIDTEGNLNLGTRTGNANLTVLGGSDLSIENQASNYDAKNPNEGQVNVTSYSNSVNIKSNNVTGIINPWASKGIFIDASQFDGVVQIRAGTGGVEVWSSGDINFNCGGNFNVNAAGDVNIKGKSTPDYTGPPTAQAAASLGLVNLNPVVPFGIPLPLRTLNNEEQWPSVPI